jgi:hypothetical protein
MRKQALKAAWILSAILVAALPHSGAAADRLETPTALEATAVSPSEIDLRWTDNSGDETAFRIERKAYNAGNWQQLGDIPANATTFRDTGLTTETRYLYRIFSVRGNANSGYSEHADATTPPTGLAPAAPSALAAWTVSPLEIALCWTDNAKDETAFKIERRRRDDGTWQQVWQVGANVTNYNSTGLDGGTMYEFRVRAYNALGNSDYSSIAEAATAAAMVGVPVKVFLLAGQSNMGGASRASELPLRLQTPLADVLFHNGDEHSLNGRTLMTLRPTTNGGAGFGPEITFGDALASANPAEVYALIKYAAAGTSLHGDWTAVPPDGVFYRNFKDRVAAGLEALKRAGYVPTVVGMLWLQGESDTLPELAPFYERDLTAFIAAIRADYGENLPFIVGGIAWTGYAGRPTVMQACADVAGRLSNVRFFSNDDINADHHDHFNTEQMQVIGRRYAAEYTALPHPEPRSR